MNGLENMAQTISAREAREANPYHRVKFLGEEVSARDFLDGKSTLPVSFRFFLSRDDHHCSGGEPLFADES